MKLSLYYLLILFTFVRFFGFSQNDIEQPKEKLRGYYSFSGGVASFPGYCIGFELGAIKKLNNFSLAVNYYSEYGNRAPGFITKYTRYNDIFFEIALYYGRLFMKKKFVFHVEGGPGLFFYNDKSLGSSGGYLTTNSTDNDRTTSVGLSAQTGIDYYFSKKIACGLKANSNLNANYFIFGAQARLVVFMN